MHDWSYVSVDVRSTRHGILLCGSVKQEQKATKVPHKYSRCLSHLLAAFTPSYDYSHPPSSLITQTQQLIIFYPPPLSDAANHDLHDMQTDRAIGLRTNHLWPAPLNPLGHHRLWLRRKCDTFLLRAGDISIGSYHLMSGNRTYSMAVLLPMLRSKCGRPHDYSNSRYGMPQNPVIQELPWWKV